VASDLSERSLDQARRGVFRGRSLRLLPHPEAGALLKVDGDRAYVAREVHAAIAWRQINLLDHAPIAALGRFDLVLCRNVLIYFTESTTRTVIEHLRGALQPGGYLAVGVSESLMRFGTALQCEERGGFFFYQQVDQ
jgi:chemotaxis protein methyltransferase CheR